MASYSFETTWKIAAPQEAVWNTLVDSKTWPTWWKGVTEVRELNPGDASRLGNISLITWRSFLPYSLQFRCTVTRMEPMHLMAGIAEGDLDGTGTWILSHANGITTVIYQWEVRTKKSWMNFLAPLLRPLFKWNHDIVMCWGGEGLAKKLGAKLM